MKCKLEGKFLIVLLKVVTSDQAVYWISGAPFYLSLQVDTFYMWISSKTSLISLNKLNVSN